MIIKSILNLIGIVGVITTSKVEQIGTNKGEILQNIACKTQKIIENQIRKSTLQKEHQEILIGILLGNDEQIEQQLKEDFVNSSLSHILAVSGMHVAYIITIVDYLFSKLKIGKKKTKILTIFFLVFFMSLANHTPSVRRACIMASLSIFANIIYQKSDVINNMAISILVILVQNPFSIFNTGLILSYSATLGIVLLTPIFLSKENVVEKSSLRKIWNQKIKPVIVVSISSWIAIFPISIMLFNTISFTFIFSNVIVSNIIGIIIMLGIIVSIPIKVPILSNIIFTFLNILLLILVKVSEIFSNIPLSHILVGSPNVLVVILYYLFVLLLIYKKSLKRKKI